MRKSYRKHQTMSVMGVREKDDFQQGEQVLELLLQVNKKKDVWIDGVSILTQACSNVDPAKFLAPHPKGMDDLIR